MPEIDGFDSLVAKLTQAKKLSTEIENSWKNINKNAKAISGGGGSSTGGTKGVAAATFGGSSGGGGGGSRRSNGMPEASFGNDRPGIRQAMQPYKEMGGLRTAFNEFYPNKNAGRDDLTMRQRMGNSISRVGSMLPDIRNAAGSFGPSDLVTYMGTLAGSVNQFLPGVNPTINRAAGYYEGGIYGGNKMSRKQLQEATFGTLAGMNGMTSTGSDANVAKFLGGRGMTASKDANSTYQQTLRSVGNAALYMNISNEDAAASIENLTSAKGAASTLQNFGIYTADLNTGKEKTQGQIFEELAQRLTAGRGQATTEQTQASIRRGALGVTVDAFFKGDEQGASMFKQYMIERSKGKKMDLSQSGDIAQSIGSGGNVNPLNAQMALAGSDTGVMQASEESFIKGINGATGALQVLNKVAESFGKNLGEMSAYMQTLMGAGTVRGMVQGVTGTVDFASRGMSAIADSMLSANLPGAAMQAGIVGVGLGVGFAAAGAGAYGTNFGGVTAPASTAGSSGGAENNSGAISWTGTADSAAKAPSSTSGSSFDSKQASKGHKQTSTFGVVDKAHPTPHKGTDFVYSVGQPVKSISNGVVIKAVTGRGNTYPAGPRSMGNHVAVYSQAGDGKKYTVFYGHLSAVKVKEGQNVSVGDVIGLAGNTGYSTGPHLHLQVDKGRQTVAGVGTPVDPQSLDGEGSSVPGESGAESAAQATAMGAQYNSIAASQAGNLGNLAGLYSGNKESVLRALGSMANNMKAGATWNAGITQSGGTYLPGSTSVTTGGGMPPVGSGGGGDRNVSIVVQVPDVTSADAIKFAQMVKQYLDDDSLLSNTGSI